MSDKLHVKEKNHYCIQNGKPIGRPSGKWKGVYDTKTSFKSIEFQEKRNGTNYGKKNNNISFFVRSFDIG